jgi:hypothetical protein
VSRRYSTVIRHNALYSSAVQGAGASGKKQGGKDQPTEIENFLHHRFSYFLQSIFRIKIKDKATITFSREQK